MSVRKRGLALLMCICMIFTLLPFSVFAEDGAEGESTPTVADGKVMIKGSETVYDSLNAALAQAENGAVIYLGAGKYNTIGANPDGCNTYADKTFTFIGAGAGKTIWQMGTSEAGKGGEDGDYTFDGAEKVTFENMTLCSSVTPNGKMVNRNNTGFVRIDHIVVNNCAVEGRTTYWGYVDTEFHGTTFYAPGCSELSGADKLGDSNSMDYSLWIATGHKFTFDKCTFYAVGKIIKVYSDYGASTTTQDIVINYSNCTVINSGANKKAVMAIDDRTMAEGFKYIINISGNNDISGISIDDITTSDKEGIDAHITCSRLFGFDEATENTGKTTVNIDGVKVWEDGKMVRHAVDTAYDKYTDGYKDNAFKPSERVVGNVTYKTKTCLYCGWSETKTEWDIDVSKSATALDTSTWTTDVTLSVPSTEQNLAADVVFVMDGSSSAADAVVEESLSLLNDLRASVSDSGADVNVCIVKFKRQAYKSEWFDLSTEYEKIKEAMETKYSGGTNIHAGLLAGKAALEEHAYVSANRKYLILISDGSTYLYSKDGNWASDTPFTRSYYTKDNYKAAAGGFNDEGLYEPNKYTDVNVPRPTNTSDAAAWQAYLKDVEARNAESSGDNYDYHCNYDLNFNQGKPSEDFKSQPCVERSANNRDMAFYYADQVWQQIKAEGYNAYSIAEKDGMAGAGNADDSHCFMNYLNGGASLNFADIKKAIIYAVGEGSTVTDEIGAGFTLVEDSLSVSVGDNELKSYTVKNDDGTWTAYFGDAEGESLKESARFTVVYKDGVLTWTFNEAASNFEPAQLSYTLKLANPETSPGTYGQLDLNGDGKIDNTDTAVNAGKALYTNKSAVLKPVDSQGNECENVVFPMPSVEYTVKPAPAPKTVLTITAGSAEGYGPDAITCDKWTADGLKDGDTVASVTITGKQSVPGSSANVASGAVIKNAAGKDVTANYDIKYVDGTLTMIEILNKEVHFNYIIGYTDGTIRPDNNISRAEVATIFFRLLNDDVRDKVMTTDCDFSDVAEGSWCRRAIATLNSLGIIKGYNDGTFRPNAEITRAELATIISRFADLDVNTKTFSDISGHWAQKYIELAAGNGWINGYKDGTFRPDEKIIRSETFAMINRVLGRVTENVSDLLPQSDMNMWSDNMDEDAWYYKDVQEATNYHKCERVGDSVYEKWTEKVPDIDWAKYQL